MSGSTRNTTAGTSTGRVRTRGRSGGAVGVDPGAALGEPLAAVGRRLLWMPVLLVGAGVYWSLALGLGGRSFELLAISDEQLEIAPDDAAEPIVVDLVPESAVESLTGTSGADALGGCGPDREPASADVRIGRTAF